MPFGVSSGGLGVTFEKVSPGTGGGEEGLLLPSVPSGGRDPRTAENEVPGWPGAGEPRASPSEWSTPWLSLVSGKLPTSFLR